MRRTLALAGAAVLTLGLTGLAGPASADTGIAQQEPDALLGEIAVDLDSSSGFEGTYVRLINETASNVPLDAYELSTCSATGPLVAVVTESMFDFNHVVPAGGGFLIADQAYADFGGPAADIVVPDLGLDQSAGGVQLSDTFASLDHSVKWNDPHPDCAGFPDAGIDPNDLQSMNYDTSTDTWSLETPTPGI